MDLEIWLLARLQLGQMNLNYICNTLQVEYCAILPLGPEILLIVVRSSQKGSAIFCCDQL